LPDDYLPIYNRGPSASRTLNPLHGLTTRKIRNSFHSMGHPSLPFDYYEKVNKHPVRTTEFSAVYDLIRYHPYFVEKLRDC
ncbi:hypothetical protein MXB_2371, partial [Myxobolus squamalis]